MDKSEFEDAKSAFLHNPYVEHQRDKQVAEVQKAQDALVNRAANSTDPKMVQLWGLWLAAHYVYETLGGKR